MITKSSVCVGGGGGWINEWMKESICSVRHVAWDFGWPALPLSWSNELARVPCSRTKPPDLYLSLWKKKKSLQSVFRLSYKLIGLGVLQRDFSKLISLLLSWRWNKQKSFWGKADKTGRKMCGKWGRTAQGGPSPARRLWKGCRAFIHGGRLFASFFFFF